MESQSCILNEDLLYILEADLICAKPSSFPKNDYMRAVSAEATEFTNDTPGGIPIDSYSWP